MKLKRSSTSYVANGSFQGIVGKKEPLPRFIKEDSMLPPIFGSYKYDPIKEVFDVDPPQSNETIQNEQHNVQNGNQTHSSKSLHQLLKKRPFATPARYYRKHVSNTIPTNTVKSSTSRKLLNWWSVPKSLQIKNTTSHKTT